MLIRYRGVPIEIVEEDDEYCFSFHIENDLHIGQFSTEDRAIEVAKQTIDEELGVL